MSPSVQTLQEDHAQLRTLLANCEGASPQQFGDALRRLEALFVPHCDAKLRLYDSLLRTLKENGDKTSGSLLSIFRSNMRVMSEAVMGFLRSPDPHPERFQQRFRTVAVTLRKMLETEEKVVFPICTRHSRIQGGQT
jgi:hypothetical protein